MTSARSPVDGAGAQPGLTRRIAVHLAATRFEDVPRQAVAAAKASLFDTLGVLLAGSGPGSSPARFLPVLERWGGVSESSVIGHACRLPAPHAAFINGAMGHQFDFDDVHDAALVHPTSSALPAALAVAESRQDCPGRELLRALVLANDVACRVGLAVPGSYTNYAFLRGPVIGVVAATVAAASLLDLDAERVEWALGHALHQTGVTLQCLNSGSEVRGMRDGYVARAGVTAAWLAKAGVRGDAGALEERYGLLETFFRGEYVAERLTVDLGVRYEGAHVSLKPWPSSREGHAAIRALLQLRDQHRLQPGDVRDIHLHVGPIERKYCDGALRSHPRTRSDALQSLPFGLALALLYGTLPLRAYEGDIAASPAAALTNLVTWEVDPARTSDWEASGLRVAVTLADGRRLEAIGAQGYGSPRDPLPPALVKAKFSDCASLAKTSFDDSMIETIHEVTDALDRLPVSALSRALTG